MPRKILFLILLLCVVWVAGCSGEKDAGDVAVVNKPAEPAPPPTVSFYYWKTVYDPGPLSLACMEELNANRLYVRFFEVTLNQWNEPVPHATVVFNQKPDRAAAPVIYFDLKVFAQANLNVEKFAQNLVDRVMEMGAYHELAFVKELHIDCDWTPSTRERFFAFTAAVKELLPADWQLAVTLRLDQVKNFNATGVPTGADKAVIMAYNMGNLRQPGPHNSILDSEISALYLKPDNPYPLSLDVALPLFEWVVVFNNRDEFTGLLRVVPPELFDPAFCRDEDNAIYTVLQPFDTGDGWVAIPGFRLRLESSHKEDIMTVAKLLAKAAPQSGHVIFFHLDDKIMKGWSAGDLKAIADNCR